MFLLGGIWTQTGNEGGWDSDLRKEIPTVESYPNVKKLFQKMLNI